MIGKQRIWGDTATARARLSNAQHVPGYLYSSPEVYALEKEAASSPPRSRGERITEGAA